MLTSEIWQNKILNNSLEQILLFVIAFIFFNLILKILQNIILFRLEKIAKKSETKAGQVFIHIVESIKPPFYYFLAFYFALNFLVLGQSVRKIINAVLIVWVVYEVVLCAQVFTDYLVRRSMGAEREKDAKAAVGLIKIIVSILLWVFGALFVFSNLGINITSLVAGLGIGGIAVALAIQNILRDLFSSFAIFFDKPFSVGDYIAVGDLEGVAKSVGIKTTRLQALTGEEIIISNQELTSAKIKNFSKLKERRVNFSFRVALDTPEDKLKKLSENFKKIMDNIELARFDRIVMLGFDKDGMNYELVFHILSNQFETHLIVQEKILFELKTILKQENIKIV